MNDNNYKGELITIDNHDFYLYLPENYKQGDTISLNLYWPGAGGYNISNGDFEKAFKEDGNYMVIANKGVWTYYQSEVAYNHSDRITQNQKMNDIYNKLFAEIQERYGVTPSFEFSYGFSAGGNDSLYYALDYIRNNPNSNPVTIVEVDPYSSSGQYNSETWMGLKFTDEDVSNMKQNGSSFWLLTRNNRSIGEDQIQQFANLVNNDIPVIIARTPYDHGPSCRQNMDNGFADFINGYRDDLDNFDHYIFEIPSTDENGNVTWRKYKISELSEEEKRIVLGILQDSRTDIDRSKLYTRYSLSEIKDSFTKFKDVELFASNKDSNIVYSDYNTAIGYLNPIVSDIKSFGDISINSNYGDCTSTTKVPSAEPQILYSVMTAINKLISNILTDANNIANIAQSFEDMDANLSKIQDILFPPVQSIPTGSSGGGYVSYSGRGYSFSQVGNQNASNLTANNVENVQVSKNTEEEYIEKTDSNSEVYSNSVQENNYENDENVKLDEPIVDVEPQLNQNNTNKNDIPIVTPQGETKQNKGNASKIVGATLGIGALSAGAVYGAKKVKEMKDNNEIEEYEDEEMSEEVEENNAEEYE